MKTEEHIIHKSQMELEEMIGETLKDFKEKKVFNEDSPMQFTNYIIASQIIAELEKEEPDQVYNIKGFSATAVRMYQTDYPRYRKMMEIAGYTYVRRTK